MSAASVSGSSRLQRNAASTRRFRGLLTHCRAFSALRSSKESGVANNLLGKRTMLLDLKHLCSNSFTSVCMALLQDCSAPAYARAAVVQTAFARPVSTVKVWLDLSCSSMPAPGCIATTTDLYRSQTPIMVETRFCSLGWWDQSISQPSLAHTTAMQGELLQGHTSPDQHGRLIRVLALQRRPLALAVIRR